MQLQAISPSRLLLRRRNPCNEALSSASPLSAIRGQLGPVGSRASGGCTAGCLSSAVVEAQPGKFLTSHQMVPAARARRMHSTHTHTKERVRRWRRRTCPSGTADRPRLDHGKPRLACHAPSNNRRTASCYQSTPGSGQVGSCPCPAALAAVAWPAHLLVP